MLSRTALARVFESLVRQEIAASLGRSGRGLQPFEAPLTDDTRLTDGLGCDSLALLHAGAAVNEMFHLHEAGDATDLLGDDRIGTWLDTIETAWRTGVDRITFLTSGSTGSPRRCTHRFSFLADEIAALAAVFDDRARVVRFAPAHHIYGFLFGAALPDRLGLSVWNAERAGAAEISRDLSAGDLVVAFPERWAWLERSLPSWPADVVGTTSTAPCPPALVEALAARGLSRMVEIYGSSETAGIGLRTGSGAAFALMPQWERLENADGASTLVHRLGTHATLPDRVIWNDTRHFQVLGRCDGAVQVGGTNVFPATIAARLTNVGGVAAIRVRLMRADEGTRLKAFVVAETGVDTAALEGELMAWSAAHLRPVERPTVFSFGPALPETLLGKPADW